MKAVLKEILCHLAIPLRIGGLCQEKITLEVWHYMASQWHGHMFWALFALIAVRSSLITMGICFFKLLQISKHLVNESWFRVALEQLQLEFLLKITEWEKVA